VNEEMWLMTDKAMIESPDYWPRWPLLPIKRKWGLEPCVALISEEHGRLRVAYGANLWDTHVGLDWVEFDVDELLREGWVVD